MNNPKTALLFPGQGSQTVGMGYALAQAYPVANEIFMQADETLGFSLSRLAWEGPEDSLNDTINTQPALLTHSIAALKAFKQVYPDIMPTYVAGHSMGELSALVAAEALTFTDGLRLVRIRGELMKQAGEKAQGGMAAVLGLEIPQLEQLCTQASKNSEIVQVANDNCPGQVVISGANPALERVLPMIKQAGARKVVRLAVSIAAHSPLMIHAQADFNNSVEATPIKNPSIPIIGNVTASTLLDAQAIRRDLQDQLTHRVRWTETIQYLISEGITDFIEVGSGSVLGSLIKRIDRQVKVKSLGTPEDFQQLH
jgi:[acyl-carrier-protein] S-malonyltransferase